MSIKLVVDMNLSPDWATYLAANGFGAIHWSAVGNPRATDAQVMNWARLNGHVVFTHDLGFATTLALTHATGPSVVQVRARDVLPAAIGPTVIAALQQHAAALATGAIVVVDLARQRVRVLPI